jgi:hypothetical protein
MIIFTTAADGWKSERTSSFANGRSVGECFFEVAEEIKRSTRRGGAQFLIALALPRSDICAHHYTAFLILLRHGCKRIYSKARGKFVEADCYSLHNLLQYKERLSPSALLICISSRKMHSPTLGGKIGSPSLFSLSLRVVI